MRSDLGICHVLKKYVSPTIIISYNDFDLDCALHCVYKYAYHCNTGVGRTSMLM